MWPRSPLFLSHTLSLVRSCMVKLAALISCLDWPLIWPLETIETLVMSKMLHRNFWYSLFHCVMHSLGTISFLFLLFFCLQKTEVFSLFSFSLLFNTENLQLLVYQLYNILLFESSYLLCPILDIASQCSPGQD